MGEGDFGKRVFGVNNREITLTVYLLSLVNFRLTTYQVSQVLSAIRTHKNRRFTIMKTWTAIGAIFSCIGVVLLIAGLARGFAIVNTLDQTGLSQYLGQLEGALFWSAFEPFLIGSIIMFIIGGVGFYAGGSASTIEMNEPNTAVSSESKILCGSCRAINDIDAVYCKKCGKQLL